MSKNKREHRQRQLKKSEIDALDASLEALQKIPEPAAPSLPPIPDQREIAAVEREAVPESHQPRLQLTHPMSGFGLKSAAANIFQTYRQLRVKLDDPHRQSDSRPRDAWLRQFVESGMEPFLSNVIFNVSTIDANRKYVITGGRNQVLRYARILRANGQYRANMVEASSSFHCADMQALQEVVRQVDGGPLMALKPLDSARCRLTGYNDKPLAYTPMDGSGEQLWPEYDYLRVATPSSDEAMLGLGWCSVSRCIEMAKLLIAIYTHDHEMLGSHPLRGLLLLRGVGEEQWEDAMQSREEVMEGKEWQYFGGLGILANPDAEIDAKLVAISQLPANFDYKVFNELCMDAYSMAVGYDVREFVSRGAGTWGTASETQSQQMGAMTKGGATFILGWRDQVSREDIWPQSLDLEIESRSDEADLLEVNVKQAKAAYISALYGAGLQQGAPLLGGGTDMVLAAERAMQLAVSEKLVPEDWANESDKQMSGDQSLERLLANPAILRAIENNPSEEIVRYTSGNDKAGAKLEVLALAGGDLIQRRSWSVARANITQRLTAAMRKRAMKHWDALMPEQAGALA
jgi:hypothetical protein